MSNQAKPATQNKAKNKGVKLITPTGRVAFIKNIFQPNKDGKYGTTLVYEANQANLNLIEEAITKAAKELWGDSYDWKKAKAAGKLKLGYGEVDYEAAEKYKFLENKIKLSANTIHPVGVIDINNNEVFEGDIKAGYYCRLSVLFKAMDHDKGKAIACYLQGVQLVKEGEPFYSRQSTEQLFENSTLDVEVGSAPAENDF